MPIDLGPIVLRGPDGKRFQVDTREEADRLLKLDGYTCLAGMGQGPATDPDSIAKLMDWARNG